MTEKDLRKLGRADLLELLLRQTEENERLQAELNLARQQLADRRLRMENVGSIAEASLQLNGVFEAAQKAADEYLATIRERSESQDLIFQQMENDAKERAQQLLVDTEMRCKARELATEQACEELVKRSKEESDEYWCQVSQKLDEYLRQHTGLRELLSRDLLSFEKFKI